MQTKTQPGDEHGLPNLREWVRLQYHHLTSHTHTHENENVLTGRCDRKKNLVWIKERNRYQITGFLVGSVCSVLPMSKTNPCMPQSKAKKIPSE